ncbi:hypothetical protein TRAPUB_4221, partial [Trametes pubescens]
MNHLNDALARFHQYREVFRVGGVREEGFSLPRQHSMVHYEKRIWDFAAPNGLCSSITESKHIKAVKEPWRRSNRYEALGQMLLTNQRMDKLAISRVHFENRGMLKDTCLREAQLLLDPQAPNPRRRGPQAELPKRTSQDKDNGGDLDNPALLAEVTLSKG